MKMLKESGVGSHPGTAAEILDQQIRDIISPGRITVKDWITIIKYAHSIGIPTTSTIMYGHVETSKDKAKHLGLLRTIQKQTRGVFRICSSEASFTLKPLCIIAQLSIIFVPDRMGTRCSKCMQSLESSCIDTLTTFKSLGLKKA